MFLRPLLRWSELARNWRTGRMRGRQDEFDEWPAVRQGEIAESDKYLRRRYFGLQKELPDNRDVVD